MVDQKKEMLVAGDEVSSNEDINRDTMRRIIDLTLPDFELQMGRWDALDSKAWNALGAASLSLTLGLSLGDPETGVIAAGIVAFLVAAFGAVWTVWGRAAQTPINANYLWEKYWDESVDTLERMLVHEIQNAARHNSSVLRNKSTALTVAFAGAVLSIVCALLAGAS
ncbi:MAG: hypothetical protein JWM90_2366 [Thermoleophilia bacterium]|nr:hypothetical protein [Thermoleophilia bacterium]